MNKSRSIRQIFLVIALFTSLPGMTLAQKSDLNHLILAIGAEAEGGVLTGNTGGAYSLASISNRDRHKSPCLGYSDPQPDHIITLENDLTRLTLQVDSGGSDTTLVVKDLESNTIRCAFGQQDRRDAVIQDERWSAGSYYIWVGSMLPNQRSPYRLSVQP